MLEFVADPSPVVRGEALGAAMALLDPDHPDGRAVEPLAAALRDARPSARERARMAALLGRTGAPRAAPLLVELVHAHDPALRLAAIDALGTLGGQAPSGAVPSAADVQPASVASTADAALLEVLGSPDAGVRLHAAVALSEAGGATARDALLAKLDGGDEVDRAALLTALGGVLARAPSEAAVARLKGALELAAGPERDGIVEALGRAPLGSAVKALAAVAKRDEPADRRAAATLLAAHPGDPAALTAVRALLEDPERRRARAGRVDARDASATRRTWRACPPWHARRTWTPRRTRSPPSAASRARAHAPGVAVKTLCPFAGRSAPLRRANALAGLALLRRALRGERRGRADRAGRRPERGRARRGGAAPVARSDRRRRARARAVRAQRPIRSGRRPLPLAARRVPARTHAALVYVVPRTPTQPRPSAPYAMLLADGTHPRRHDRPPRRVFDPVAPEGEVTLRRPSALAR